MEIRITLRKTVARGVTQIVTPGEGEFIEFNLPEMFKDNGIEWTLDNARQVMIRMMPIMNWRYPGWGQIWVGLPDGIVDVSKWPPTMEPPPLSDGGGS